MFKSSNEKILFHFSGIWYVPSPKRPKVMRAPPPSPHGSRNPTSPPPDLTRRLTDLNLWSLTRRRPRRRRQRPRPGGPRRILRLRPPRGAAAPGRTRRRRRQRRKVRSLRAFRVLGFGAVGLESSSWGFWCFGADQGADKPSSAVAAESSKRRKEPEQQQPAAPWAKLLSHCSQVRWPTGIWLSDYLPAVDALGIEVEVGNFYAGLRKDSIFLVLLGWNFAISMASCRLTRLFSVKYYHFTI
jgi:hypothetical protein